MIIVSIKEACQYYLVFLLNTHFVRGNKESNPIISPSFYDSVLVIVQFLSVLTPFLLYLCDQPF